jgi:hypothetical protein
MPEDLEHALAETVLAVPGVVRLEPSLTQALASLRGQVDPRPAVQLRRRGYEVRLVRADVVVHDARSADLTASAVRTALVAALADRLPVERTDGRPAQPAEGVRVEVVVLGVERDGRSG